MFRLFHCLGIRDAVEVSDYRFEAPLTKNPFEPGVNSDPAQVAMDVLLDRMWGDAGLAVAEPTTRALPDVEAALLTPRLLRLARRPGQDAGSYVRKLRDDIAAFVAQRPVKMVP